LLQKQGFNIKLLLSDFGYAKSSNESWTYSGNRGTLSYSSPELLSLWGPHEHGIDFFKPSDVYSLGVTFWSIYHLKEPFDDVSGFNRSFVLYNQIVSQNRKPVLDDTCPSRLKEIITKCLQTDPKERFTCNELLQELESYEKQLIDEFNSKCNKAKGSNTTFQYIKHEQLQCNFEDGSELYSSKWNDIEVDIQHMIDTPKLKDIEYYNAQGISEVYVNFKEEILESNIFSE